MFSTSSMKRQDIPDWIILGDNSRALFLQWLFPGAASGTEENGMIWVRHGIRYSCIRQKGQWMMETPMLLPQMTLCFPPAGSTIFDLEIPRQTRCAVLEEFPFRKQSNMDLIQTFEQRGHEVLVILMDLPRHQGSTDLIAPGVDLSRAAESYRAKHCDVSVMKNAGNLQRVLHWHRPLYDIWVNKVRQYLSGMRERISEIPYDYPSLEEDWRDDGGILQEQTLDRLFSYQTAKREKTENLWDCYAAASRKALFPSSGQGPLLQVAQLYRECLDNHLVFWPVDADVEDFIETLRNAFIAVIDREERRGCYRKKTRFTEQPDEESYLSIVARSGNNGTALNAVFSQMISDFLCKEVQTRLQERLQQRYQQLEGMIP